MDDPFTQLKDAFSTVFEGQPINGVKKTDVSITLVDSDKTETVVEPKFIKKICKDADDGGNYITIDFENIKSDAGMLRAAMALIYGEKTVETNGKTNFKHRSGDLFTGWMEVLAFGKGPKNIEPKPDVVSALVA